MSGCDQIRDNRDGRNARQTCRQVVRLRIARSIGALDLKFRGQHRLYSSRIAARDGRQPFFDGRFRFTSRHTILLSERRTAGGDQGDPQHKGGNDGLG